MLEGKRQKSLEHEQEVPLGLIPPKLIFKRKISSVRKKCNRKEYERDSEFFKEYVGAIIAKTRRNKILLMKFVSDYLETKAKKSSERWITTPIIIASLRKCNSSLNSVKDVTLSVWISQALAKMGIRSTRRKYKGQRARGYLVTILDVSSYPIQKNQGHPIKNRSSTATEPIGEYRELIEEYLRRKVVNSSDHWTPTQKILEELCSDISFVKSCRVRSLEECIAEILKDMGFEAKCRRTIGEFRMRGYKLFLRNDKVDDGNPTKVCDYMGCKVTTLIPWKDKNAGEVYICNSCYNKVKKKYSRAEIQMINYLKQNSKIAPYIVLTDKVVAHDACNTNRRPDILISSGGLYIIVECDENQHKYYSPLCEWGRMDELIDEFKSGRVVFLRWNPNNYQVPIGCKTKKMKERLQALEELILDISSGEKQVPEHIKIFYMYYDEDNPVIAKRWAKELLR